MMAQFLAGGIYRNATDVSNFFRMGKISKKLEQVKLSYLDSSKVSFTNFKSWKYRCS